MTVPVIRYRGQFIDKHGALVAKVIDDVTVVHHFVTHVNGSAKQLQGTINDLDGPIDAGTESAGVG